MSSVVKHIDKLIINTHTLIRLCKFRAGKQETVYPLASYGRPKNLAVFQLTFHPSVRGQPARSNLFVSPCISINLVYCFVTLSQENSL